MFLNILSFQNAYSLTNLISCPTNQNNKHFNFACINTLSKGLNAFTSISRSCSGSPDFQAFFFAVFLHHLCFSTLNCSFTLGSRTSCEYKNIKTLVINYLKNIILKIMKVKYFIHIKYYLILYVYYDNLSLV